MTLTYQGLAQAPGQPVPGAVPEPFAETVRRRLESRWPNPHDEPIGAPFIHSTFGSGGAPPDYDRPRTYNDALAARSHGRLAVEIEEGDTTASGETAALTTGETAVYIDIYGSPKAVHDARRQIDDLIASDQPTVNNRWRQWHNHSFSAIIGLKENVPDWTYVPADEDADITAQYAGTITVLWAAARTN